MRNDKSNRTNMVSARLSGFFASIFSVALVGALAFFLPPATRAQNASNPPADTIIQFSRSSFEAQEGAGSVTVTVVRTGVLTGNSAVDYAIGRDDDGTDTATQRSDFTFTSGTLKFNPGEATKTFVVLITQNSFVQGMHEAKALLSNPIGAALGQRIRASVEIDDDDVEGEENPNDDHPHFVRQHYHDFLNREPDPGGLAYWVTKLDDCNHDVQCLEVERTAVSAAFYISQEFQETGFFVVKMERASFNRRPGYQNFMGQVQEISRNTIANGVETTRQQFADDWANRPEFRATYDSLNNATYVDQLYGNAGITPNAVTRQRQIDDLDNNRRRRGEILREVVEDSDFSNRHYNAGFVLMQYFGYLRRDPDEAGYQFWVDRMNDTANAERQSQMVRAFVRSVEYRVRFGAN